MNRKWRNRLAWMTGIVMLYLVLVSLGSWYNDAPYGDWKSEIYGDKAGYYIYLPATFIHGYQQSAYPEGTEKKLGFGVKFKDGKLFTKYPMGVAALNLPFFFIAHVIALTGEGPADGFSGIYYEMSYFASGFYFIAGALILLVLLRRRYSWLISSVTVVLFMFGSNLYYYALRETYMSHIYSFALFSLLLLLTDNLWKNPGPARLILVMLVSGLIMLVRPSNAIFLPVILLLGLSSVKELKQRIKFILSPKNALVSVVIVLLVMLPQLIYWKFISGQFLFNTYQGEGFTNWDRPMVAEVMLSPANGLLPYTPVFLLIIAGFFVMIFRKEPDRWLIPGMFLILLYMVSSWYAYRFGCSFGQRSFVEYLALFSIAFASFLRWSFNIWKPFLMSIILALFTYLIYVNINLAGVYNKCHQGEDWDWHPYWFYYKKAEIFPFNLRKHTETFFEDFEGEKPNFFSRIHTVRSDQAFSDDFVTMVNDSLKYSDGFGADLNKFTTGRILKVQVSLQCYFTGPPGKTLMVCSINEGDELIYYETQRIDDKPEVRQGSWNLVTGSFDMRGLPPRGHLKLYVWHLEGDETLIDDLEVTVFSEKEHWEPPS